MKKFIIISIIITFLAPNIFAQNKLNIYAAVNFGLSKVKFSPSNGVSINKKFSGGFGAHLIYPVATNINIVTMPSFTIKGYEYSNFNSNDFFGVRISYLEIPVVAEFRFGLQGLISKDVEREKRKPFYFGAGFYGGLAVGGKYNDHTALGETTTKIKFGEGLADNRSRLDYGLQFTLGISIGDFRMGLLHQVGLKNAVPAARKNQGLSSNKNINSGFFIAYNIGKFLKKKN